MQRAELQNEVLRLYRGHGKPESLLTPERSQTLFERYGHIPRSAFSAAVSAALREHTLPSASWLEAAVEREWDSYRAHRASRERQATPDLLGDLLPAGEYPGFGGACMRLARARIEDLGFSLEDLIGMFDAFLDTPRRDMALELQDWLRGFLPDGIDARGERFFLHREPANVQRLFGDGPLQRACGLVANAVDAKPSERELEIVHAMREIAERERALAAGEA